MGKSDSCAAPGCNHTSRGFCSFYYFPTHNPWRTLWIQALNRKPVTIDGTSLAWEPTSWDRLCSCHFTNPPNPKSRRLDAKWVVPDIFEGSERPREEPAEAVVDNVRAAQEISGSLYISEITKLLAEKACSAKNLSKNGSAAVRKSPRSGTSSQEKKKSQEKKQTLAQILSTPPQHHMTGNQAAQRSDNSTAGSSSATALPSDQLLKDEKSKQTGMSLLEDQIQARLVQTVKDAIIDICQQSLCYNSELSIQGLIGITLDKNSVILLDLRESRSREKPPEDETMEETDTNYSPTPRRPSKPPEKSRKRPRTSHRNPIPDWKQARGEVGVVFQNPDIRNSPDLMSDSAVIKIEPLEPEEEGPITELQKQLQNEIQSASNKASFQTLSSKIVQIVQPELSPNNNQGVMEEDIAQLSVHLDYDDDSSDGDDDANTSGNTLSKKPHYSVEEKIQAVDTILRNSYSLEEASEVLNVDAIRLGKWVSIYDEMLKFSSQSVPQSPKQSKKGRKKQYPELDEKMCEFYMQLLSTGAHCPDSLLIKKARLMAKQMKIDNFKGSFGYIRSWKRRHFCLQDDPKYEELAQKVRQVFKHAYEDGRECDLVAIEDTAVKIAGTMDCAVFSDKDWLRKWKMHYFCQEMPSESACVLDDSYNGVKDEDEEMKDEGSERERDESDVEEAPMTASTLTDMNLLVSEGHTRPGNHSDDDDDDDDGVS